ncbi:SUMF1/EgtB/PvdO family nonheme iron enzyme [Fervidobacterium sp.]
MYISKSKRIFTLLCVFIFISSIFAVTVIYKDGTKVSGTLIDMNNERITLDIIWGKIEIPLDYVESIVFKDSLSPKSGHEFSIDGKVYDGYVIEAAKNYVVVATWFGKIKVNLNERVDYIGFEKVNFDEITNNRPFKVELGTSNSFVCVLYNGDMFISDKIESINDYVIIPDRYGNIFYISKLAIEEIYIPYKSATGYDLLVLKDGRKLYGVVKVLSPNTYEISGVWGKETVNIADVLFTTFREQMYQERTEGSFVMGLDKIIYDKDNVATMITDSVLRVNGKDVSVINVYPREIKDPRNGIEFVLIPGGTFKMGANTSWGKVDEDELPQRDVYVSSFYISKYPITVKQYLDFLRASQSSVSASVGKQVTPIEIDFLNQKIRVSYSTSSSMYNYPITGINYNSAKAYCEWAGYQLPTEAQWEKAARGTDGRMYPWGNTKPIRYNDGKKDYDVKAFEDTDVSPYGVVNMFGLPIELCRDYFDKEAYKKLPRENPLNSTSGANVVGRTGVISGRITDRIPISASETRNDVTFRVVLNPEDALNISKKPLNNKFFGVYWYVVNDSVKKQYKVSTDGLYVVYVEVGSPAQNGGIKPGDVIVAIDGKSIKTQQDAANAVSGKKQGDICNVIVNRSGKQVELKIRVGVWTF